MNAPNQCHILVELRQHRIYIRFSNARYFNLTNQSNHIVEVPIKF